MPNWKKVIVSGSNAVLNNITASGHLTVLGGGLTADTAEQTELEVQGNISASGNLFADLSDANGSHNNTVMYNTTTGQFYYTGSYGGGGSGDPGDPGSGTNVEANPGGSPGDVLTTITIGETDFSIGGQDDDWYNDSSTDITSSKSVKITGSSDETTTLDVRSTNQSIGTNVFRVRGHEDNELFSVSDNTGNQLFTVNDISGLPIFDIADTGNVTIDGNLIFSNASGNGPVMINSTDDLAGLSISGNARGEIVKFNGNGDTTTTGKLYYWTGTNWALAGNNIDAAKGAFLAVALGPNPNVNGMLIRGIVQVGTTTNGVQVYMQTNGEINHIQPTGAGTIYRSVGHSISGGVIYFNPSPDFLVLS